ncbi:hypothetical protein AVEN_243512-1 [Araneus ventricosus]|uniref:Uncharacterized protein n=1 Tax=Araneus ventricosus TaxID=182803 RepID=A0A4Y2Q5G1_ARAVE|nr:hypothetical protein AVEN_243512-1 [Araneus ventricosus]
MSSNDEVLRNDENTNPVGIFENANLNLTSCNIAENEIQMSILEHTKSVSCLVDPNNADHENVSFDEYESDDSISVAEDIEDLNPFPREASVPNFSLGVEFPFGLNDNSDVVHVQDDSICQEIPASDEIELFQIITENRSTITFGSLLPHEKMSPPISNSQDLFSCEYCEQVIND